MENSTEPTENLVDSGQAPDQKLNGEDKEPPSPEAEPQNNQVMEIDVPDEKAKSLTVSTQIMQKAEADFEIAQARLIASRNAHDALYYKICAQCGANPDEFEMQADGNKLKFVRAKK